MKRVSKISVLLILGIFISTNVYAAVGWSKSKPTDAHYVDEGQDAILENNTALDLMLSKYREGCKISYSSASQVSVAAGSVMLSNSAGTVRLMVSNTSSTTVTWADIDAGAEASSTTYYIYAYATATTATTFSVYISTNATSPTGGTYYQKLGQFYNNSSSNIVHIRNDGFFTDLGDWTSKSADTTYQATTDGWVCGLSNTDADVNIKTDNANPPTTIRVQNASGYYTGSSAGCFVRAGDYYLYTTVKSQGGDAVYWIPLN